jgi:two-component system sensor kinase
MRGASGRAVIRALASQDTLSTISRRTVLAAGLGLILVLALATAAVLTWLRADALERSEWHLANLAVAVGEQTRQSVQSVDIIVDATADELRDRYAGVRRFSDQALFEHLRDRVHVLPHLGSVVFIGANGDAVFESSGFPAPKVNYADREYFVAHRERRTAALHVGTPVRGGPDQEWVNVFSRRVEDGRGEFRGVVAAAVRMQYFEKIYRALNLGPAGRAFLFRADGVLLAVHPAVGDTVGRSFAADALFTEATRGPGPSIVRRAGLIDSIDRMIAVARLKDYPLVVAVSATEDHILGGWRRNAWRIGLGAIAASGFLGIALSFLLWQMRVSAGLKGELEQAGERLQGVIQSAMDAIITVDEEQNVVLFNAAAERIFACPAGQAIGGSLDRFIPERFRAAHRKHIEHFGKTGETTRRMGSAISLSGLRADGAEFPIDASISQITVEGRRLYTVIMRDITERKRAEAALERTHQELRALSATMNEVREAERARIARELHDELAQSLTALKMDVSWLAGRLPSGDDRARAKLERTKGLVDSTVASVRQLAHDLRPAMLDDLGLVPAIEYLLHEFSERSGVMVELDADAGGVEFKEPLTTSIYRMVQEALTNVARHARATEVRVAIRSEGDELVVSACDNGIGISAAQLQSGRSLGILGIKERARTLGGRAEVYSPGERGTLVEIRVPIRRYSGAGAGA